MRSAWVGSHQFVEIHEANERMGLSVNLLASVRLLLVVLGSELHCSLSQTFQLGIRDLSSRDIV